MGVDHRIRLACGLTADDVADRKEESTLVTRFLHRRQRIGCFAGLADPDDKTFGADYRIAITKLGRVLDFDRHSRKRFDEKFSNMSGMQRRTHRKNMQPL